MTTVVSGRRLAGWCVFSVMAVLGFSFIAPAQQYNESSFKGMNWRSIGPYRGGRVLAVAGVPGDPYTFYFGGVAGGVWRTSDAGVSWVPLTDKAPFDAVGAIAVSESNASVIYVGTGEACLRGNITYGNGVYKTTDGGKSWTHLGLDDTQHIAKVLVDPRNSDVVFVAALGHAYGPNEERGIYRSTDGGKTWTKVLYKDQNSGAIDLVFDPHNPNVMFAALYQIRRSPWSLDSGGPGSGLYRSNDGGLTWRHLEGNGLPSGMMGRIGVAVSGADSNRVYALIESQDGGLYRSDDGGEHWTKVSDDQRMTQRAWYFTHIFADPKSVDTLYILNTGLFRSTDGGKTLNLLPAPHGDHHGFWVDQTNPNRMINGNDGGATISVDGGKSWSTQYNQPTAQFYHVSADNRALYYVYGAQQDNSTVGIASRTDDGYIGRQHWYDVGGGESGYIVADPRDPNIVYAGSGGGVLTRFDKRTEQVQDITTWPFNSAGHGAKDLKYRGGWTMPIMISPHDPNVIYTSAEVVFKSTDQGHSWTAISPDLTRNDKSKQEPSGGPLTKDNTTVEYYDTVFTLAESPVQKDLIWAGTDDGLIHITRDGGKNWSKVTPKGLPEWSLVSLIEASPFDAGTAYAAVTAYKLDDPKPYIYKTTDFGKSWSAIINGIPDGSYVRAVREDPKQRGLLYAGTETGVFVSFDGGSRWQSLQLNLPHSPIHDLIVKENDLVVATHGRAFWILDDLTPLRQLKAGSTDAVIFPPLVSYRYHWPEDYEKRQPVGQNPPGGVLLSYYLAEAPKGEVTLEIQDSEGRRLRRFSSAEQKEAATPPEWPDQSPPQEKIPAEAGLNRFAWDMRVEGARKLPGEVMAEYRNRGPIALPGQYTVQLTANGKTVSAPLELKADPRIQVQEADLVKQFELEMQIRSLLSDLHDTVRQIRDTRTQLKSLDTRMGEEAHYQPVVAAARALDTKMTPIEEQLLQVKIKSTEANLNYPTMIDEQLHALADSVDNADAAPAQQQYEVFQLLQKEAQPLIAQWKQISSTDVVALNQMMMKDNVPAIYLAPAGAEGAATKAAGQN
jgi:photosystem II stability/assembly factor-like uncharacterized protein